MEIPEQGSEELYALWRDYQRKRDELAKEYRDKRAEPKNDKESSADRARRIRATVAVDTKLAPLRTAIRPRFRDANVRGMLRGLWSVNLPRRKNLPPLTILSSRKRTKGGAEELALELYSDIFSHREKESDELTCSSLPICGPCQSDRWFDATDGARRSGTLSAAFFERLKTYRSSLKKTASSGLPQEKNYSKNS